MESRSRNKTKRLANQKAYRDKNKDKRNKELKEFRKKIREDFNKINNGNISQIPSDKKIVCLRCVNSKTRGDFTINPRTKRLYTNCETCRTKRNLYDQKYRENNANKKIKNM
jgi:hypothetical protein